MTKKHPRPGLEQMVYELTKKGCRGVDICIQLESHGLRKVSTARISQIQKKLGLRKGYKKSGRPKK